MVHSIQEKTYKKQQWKVSLKDLKKPKTKAQKAANTLQNKVGKAQKNVVVRELIGTRTKKATKADIDTGIQTRSNDKKLRERKTINYKV